MIVTGDFVPTGGMDNANLALASYIARTRAPLHLVAHRIDARLDDANVAFHRVPKPLDSYTLGAPLLRSAAARTAGRLGADAVTVANGGNFTHGHVNWLHYVHAAHEPTLHGSRARRALAALNRRRFLRDERIAVRNARVVIANSDRTRRDAITLLGADPANVHVVYYGTDASFFRPPTAAERGAARRAVGVGDEPVVLFVGALGDRRKGFDRVLDAWQRGAAGNALLLVAGGGQELEAWRARASAARSNVRFLGFQRDVRPLMWAADLLVAPARYEAYGLAAHEALCCGLPVITSAHAGVAERFPDTLQSLLLQEPAALEGTLGAWRDDVAGYRTAAAVASEQLRQHSWDDMARRIVHLGEDTAANVVYGG